MGGSVSAVADGVLRRITDRAFLQSQTQNVYQHNGTWFMFEVNTRKEHVDGSITGTISRIVGDPRAEKFSAYRAGTFKIDGKTGRVHGAHGITTLAK